jgi:hypothetical protein
VKKIMNEEIRKRKEIREARKVKDRKITVLKQ